MSQDFKNNELETNESPEPSPAPSTPSNSFIPTMSTKDVKATWEMLVKFKEAIRGTMWGGDVVQEVAMGLIMISQMEGQYRSNYDQAMKRDAESAKNAKDAIKKAGGVIQNGEKLTVN